MVEAPGEEFCNLVESENWERAFAILRSTTSYNPTHVVGALALRCPSTDRVTVFISEDHIGSFSPPGLISYQILEARSAEELLSLVSKWEPAIKDLLEEIREGDREYRNFCRERKKNTPFLKRYNWRNIALSLVGYLLLGVIVWSLLLYFDPPVR